MPRISLSVCFLSLALAFSSLAQAQALQSMKAHEKLGVTCQQCHGTDTPTTAPNEKQCLSCHANSSGIIGEQSWMLRDTAYLKSISRAVAIVQLQSTTATPVPSAAPSATPLTKLLRKCIATTATPLM